MTAKEVYAQSSDIKARTYLEYRKDMKRKAIAELEFLPFLERILSNRYSEQVRVQKHGGDAELWFLSSGGVTREPDYRAEWGDKSLLYEFQYAEKGDLKYFDFKLSKVGKKKGGKRNPHKDREFFYVVKPEGKYTFVEPEWIMDKGEEGSVPAWGSRRAYRVRCDDFMPLLEDGGEDMAEVVNAINDKQTLLDFQHEFLDLEAERLSRRLQQAVDEKELLQVAPDNLCGLYEVCYLLDKIGKSPDNPGAWMVYLISFFRSDMGATEFAHFMFVLDFIYFKCESLQGDEQRTVTETVHNAKAFVARYPCCDGLFSKEPETSPLEETRCMIFAVNLLEDLTQHIAVKMKADIKKIEKIFQHIQNIDQIAKKIRDSGFSQG